VFNFGKRVGTEYVCQISEKSDQKRKTVFFIFTFSPFTPFNPLWRSILGKLVKGLSLFVLRSVCAKFKKYTYDSFESLKGMYAKFYAD